MALLNRETAEVGTGLTTHIVGVERAVRVIPSSPHDPEGRLLRT
jgi:dimethylglycine dehydrogenase